MERFTLNLAATRAAAPGRRPVLCGVVSSGNLEVLLEGGGNPGVCLIDVATSAQGYRPVWEAVLSDTVRRHAAGGLLVRINDAGATPAVVSLRLGQALQGWEAQP